mgnify:FL=1|jgi:hypothetical protein
MGNGADSLNDSGSSSIDSPEKKQLTPLEVNGITAVTIGTGIWSVATLIMVLMRDQLEASGRNNWIAIGVCGIILGLLGMRYTKRRATRIEQAKDSSV